MDGGAASERDRLPVQGFTGTPEEIERQWYSSVFRGRGDSMRQLTWRAVIMGSVLPWADRRCRRRPLRTARALEPTRCDGSSPQLKNGERRDSLIATLCASSRETAAAMLLHHSGQRS
jgi:hypothetical protein